MCIGLALCWSFFTLLFKAKPKVYLNMGQTWFAFIREGLPFALVSLLRPGMNSAISLHGHLFTRWNPVGKQMRVFRFILNRADLVTVLGEVQKKCLIDAGVKSPCIQVVNNSCEVPICTDLQQKQPASFLYLSNLIESKGYRIFLEALGELASLLPEEEAPVTNILCGKIWPTGEAGEFSSEQEARSWIEGMVAQINSYGKITVSWKEGAYGGEKLDLFRESTFFAFPSQYKVEAQPLVLLEAMASGCVIITSTVGEIPSTVSPDCSSTLEDCSAQTLAAEMLSMIQLPVKELASKQQSAIARYQQNFSPQIYKDTWSSIFARL